MPGWNDVLYMHNCKLDQQFVLLGKTKRSNLILLLILVIGNPGDIGSVCKVATQKICSEFGGQVTQQMKE